MTDYWKSNERKYCDFCQCWLSANKASVSFHESGKRHKLNVAKRITDISRSSEKSERERQKLDADIRKMENAAMRAYTYDIHARGDMTARNVSAVVNAAQSVGANVYEAVGGGGVAAAAGSRCRQVDPLRLPGNSDDEDESQQGGRVTVHKIDPEVVPNASLWVEGKTDDGKNTYYWNVKTNESVWEKPKEGYLSFAEYERINGIALQQQEIQQANEAQKFRENANEEVARYNRERLKAYRKPETNEEKKAKVERKAAYKTEEEAATQEIGGWQTVEVKPAIAPIDLELPKMKHFIATPRAATQATDVPPVKRFKEKTIESLRKDVLDSSSSSSNSSAIFKKRKFAAKGNARKRLDDD